MLLTIEDACTTGYTLQVTITQYDQNKDVVGAMLKKNSLASIDDLPDQYAKIIIGIRKGIMKKKMLFEAKSIEIIDDHNEITLHIAKVI